MAKLSKKVKLALVVGAVTLLLGTIILVVVLVMGAGENVETEIIPLSCGDGVSKHMCTIVDTLDCVPFGEFQTNPEEVTFDSRCSTLFDAFEAKIEALDPDYVGEVYIVNIADKLGLSSIPDTPELREYIPELIDIIYECSYNSVGEENEDKIFVMVQAIDNGADPFPDRFMVAPIIVDTPLDVPMSSCTIEEYPGEGCPPRGVTGQGVWVPRSRMAKMDTKSSTYCDSAVAYDPTFTVAPL